VSPSAAPWCSCAVVTLWSVDSDDQATGSPFEASPSVYIDAMNVIGARPDGWWHDRDGAVRRLAARLERFAAGLDAEVVLVVDGRPVDGLPEGPHGGVSVRYASRAGRDAADDRLIELLRARARPGVANTAGPGGAVVVVTADRALRERAAALGARWVGPRTLLRALDAACGPPS
jgi:predicted RNA-binding protein with PIN domain